VSQDRSLRSIAKEVGVSATHLSNLERGLSSPSIAMVRQLAKAYGIPVPYAISLFLDEPEDGQ
jgi:transcriptional regulator with XRE-family HTH domain